MKREDEERALSLHKKSIFIDALEVFVPFTGDTSYLDKLMAAGVTTINATVMPPYDTPLQALSRLKQWYEAFEEHSDKLIQVTTAQDIERAKREGKLGIIMGSQNAAIISDDINLLAIYKKLGLRIIQLSYYAQGLLGEGGGERTNGGLTRFGVEAVEEMNRLRLLIDVSHCGDQVIMDAIKFSKVPIVATHANPRALANHSRNKTDEHIKAIADKGGVIGIVGYSRISQPKEGIPPSIEDLLDFIDYTAKLVGPDYVGIGTDVTPFWSKAAYEEFAQFYPDLRSNWGWEGRHIFTNKEGAEDISRMVEITKGLVTRRYSDEDIQKIIGLNFLRVFREVWGE